MLQERAKVMRKHQWSVVLFQKELPDLVRQAFPDERQPRTWVDGTYLLQRITYDPITEAQAALLKVAPLSTHGICSLSCSSEEVAEHTYPGRNAEGSLEYARDEVNRQRVDNDFTTIWLLEQSIRLHLKVQARNAESASGQLPSIDVIERVLRPLFEAAGSEVDALFYDESQQTIEEHISPFFKQKES